MMTKQLTANEIDNIVALATAAGITAARSTTPTPMIVREHVNPLDDASPVKREYAPITGGVCGFAWINIKPGTSRFAKRLLATKEARKDGYYGGVTRWVSEFGQSMEMKEAFARAYAEVLRNNGITAYMSSRMD